MEMATDWRKLSSSDALRVHHVPWSISVVTNNYMQCIALHTVLPLEPLKEVMDVPDECSIPSAKFQSNHPWLGEKKSKLQYKCVLQLYN